MIYNKAVNNASNRIFSSEPYAYGGGHTARVGTYLAFIQWEGSLVELGLIFWFLNNTIKNQKVSSISNK